MIIKGLGELNKLEFKDKDLFSKYLEKYSQNFCDFNLFNLFAWSAVYDYYWIIYEGRLIIYNKTTDYIYKPIGELLPFSKILYISDSFKNSNLSGNLAFFDDNYINFIYNNYKFEKDPNKFFKVTESRDNANYIYFTEKLAYLKGRKFHNKRNLISQFTKNNKEINIKILNRTNSDCHVFKKCVELAEKWYKNKEEQKKIYNNESFIFQDNQEAKDILEMELIVLKNSCNYFKELDIGLIIIEVNNQIIGFSVYSKQNDHMATVHFEKFDLDYTGIPQFINNITAKNLIGKYQYINREDDLGIQQLRFAKNSYYPDILLIPFLLIRKE